MHHELPTTPLYTIEKVDPEDMVLALSLVRKQWPNFTDDDHEKRDLWLASKAGELMVGVASYVRETESGYVFLQDLVVEREYRRMGIGETLIRKGIETFLEDGETLMALVSTMNRNAIKFYEEIGFEKYNASNVKRNSPIGQKAHNRNCMTWGYRKHDK